MPARPARDDVRGILNVVLDPVFIFGCHLAVTGRPWPRPCPTWLGGVLPGGLPPVGGGDCVSLRPRYFTFRFMGPIFSVGLASALATTLGNAANMVMVRLAAGYGDIPVALRHCQTD